MEEAGESHKARWFRRRRLGKSAITDEEEERWEFTGDDGETREKGKFGIAEEDKLWQ